MSWTFVRAPMRIRFTSPRITVFIQTLASSPSSTSPITWADDVHVGAIAQLRPYPLVCANHPVAAEKRQFIRGRTGAAARRARIAEAADASPEAGRELAWRDGRARDAPGVPVRTGLRAGARARRGASLGDARLAQTTPPALADLRRRYPDLERHFLFEYYPWYGGPPAYEHWDYLDRQPPLDLATRYMPSLGPYDVRSVGDARAARALDPRGRRGRRRAVLVGTRQLAGPRRPADHGRDAARTTSRSRSRSSPTPTTAPRYYATTSSTCSASTARSGTGTRSCCCATRTAREGPVFKGFRTILPETSTDCLGESPRRLRLHARTPSWRRQTDSLRETLRADFDHVTLLADSLEFRAHAGLRLRRHRHLRQLHPARALPRLRRGRLARGARSSRST